MAKDPAGAWNKKPPKTDKDKALEAVVSTAEPKKKTSVYLPESMARKLSRMSADSVGNVSANDFVLEAIEMMFDAYEKGEGKYTLIRD